MKLPSSHGMASARQLLKRTASRCPTCKRACPAEVWRVDDGASRIFLERSCPVHGLATNCISSDSRFYWLAQGDPENQQNGCCGEGRRCPGGGDSRFAVTSFDGRIAGLLGRNAAGKRTDSFEKLSTCLALIEIVHSCNLACPTCYADSPVGTGARVDAVPLADLKKRIQGVIDLKGGIEILQLSGGEPTLHPHFFELLEWLQAHPGIDYVLLNTNGVRIAADDSFAQRLGATAKRGHFQLYLQFDGPQMEDQLALRGADLRQIKRKAIDRCGELGVPVTLAMTVTPRNLGFVWSAIEFGLQFPHVRGISFQPMFGSGRVREEAAGESARPLGSSDRLNTADIILASVQQSNGQLRYDDFTPLPCGDPNCATIGYLLRLEGRVHSISEFVDFTQVQGFLANRVRYSLEDLMKCGCESEPLGELLKHFELDASHTFRLFIKPFMDAWTWEEDRIDRCCTHVIRPDGKLDSFCRYYSGCSEASPTKAELEPPAP